MEKIPDHDTVKQIMDETYNKFYLKWRNALTLENAEHMMQEVRELEKKYPYRLCHDNLLNFIECIEKEYRRRSQV